MSRNFIRAVLFGALVNLLCIPAVVAQTPPDPLWIQQFGSTNGDHPRSAAADVTGVFIAGTTTGGLVGPNAGWQDVFLARYDTLGNQLWVRQFGTSESEQLYSASTDSAGGVYIGGFTPGALAGSASQGTAWFARYDADGNGLWLLQPWSAKTFVRALSPADQGGVFVSGGTDGDLGGPNAGERDVYIARFDSAGNQLWMRQFGGPGFKSAGASAPDGAGGVFIGGNTDEGILTPALGLLDAWLAHYDSEGNQLWLRQISETAVDAIVGIAPDEAGGFFVTGNYGGPSLSTIYIARYNRSGERLWRTPVLPSIVNQHVADVAPDGQGGAYIAGYRLELSPPRDDAWLARYDAAGNRMWLKKFGTPEREQVWSLAWDHVDGVYVVGETTGSLGGPNAGGADAFIARIPGMPPPLGACCTYEGSCLHTNAYRCGLTSGTFHGDYTACAVTYCPAPGACCLPTMCEILNAAECALRGGLFRGDGSECAGANCPGPAGEHLALPNMFAEATGDTYNAALVLHVPVTVQVVYSASELQIPAGAQIIGLTWRLASLASATSWPPQPADWGDYQIELSTSLNAPGSLSSTFATNTGPDAVVVRSGPLTVPALSFAGGAVVPATNEWGHDIAFTAPFSYDGGDLLITIRHSGSDAGVSRFLDSISTSNTSGGYGTRVQALVAGSLTALAGALASAPVTRITYTSGPSCYANCDGSTVEPILNVDDFTCFINEFAAGLGLPHEQQVGHYANCDGSTTAPVLTVDDFLCFIDAFAAGCP